MMAEAGRGAPVVVILTPDGLESGLRIAAALDCELHAARARVPDGFADRMFGDVAAHLRMLFAAGRAIVAVMAAGALVRILAPCLSDKRSEPPVVVLSPDGADIVPLLGGHHGGNDLARRIGEITNGHVAITTAGDNRFAVALDEPPAGYRLANPHHAKAFMARLLSGASLRLEGEAPWLSRSRLPFDGTADQVVVVSDEVIEAHARRLVYHPSTLALGLGAERHADGQDAIALVERILAEKRLARQSIACVVSLDLKADEAAVHAVADHLAVPARFFDAARLERETPRLRNPSDRVFAEVGCHGVAEAAALAAAGRDGALIVEKTKGKRVTAALARAPVPIDPDKVGHARGQLLVVGIGPGSASWCSPEVSQMIGEASDLVGYSLYLDLLGSLAADKIRHDFDLGHEEARVRHAMELAATGRTVALVCSGDAGIYAMATLVFELLDKARSKRETEIGLSDAARRIAIAVAPGISALQAAAARAGAPLGHDFCTISLSDLLTPWPVIEARVRAAAEADFVIAFYNPVSQRRRVQLAHARDILLHNRPADTPVVLASNLGRKGERVRLCRLADLRVEDVDMLTVVIVGSSMTRLVSTGDGRQWAYTPRGYAGKTGSAMAASTEETTLLQMRKP